MRNATTEFYRNKLPYKEKQFNFIFPLDGYFKELIGDKKEVKIADIGCGMFSTTGSTLEGVEVEIYPSDFLADEYNEMLRDSNVTPVIPVEKQDMTNLTYKDEFFDVVHCVNALDHCNDPQKALQEMLRVLKPGGWLYLRHYQNVGEFMRYRGEHKWNIDLSEDGIKVWSRNGTEYFFTGNAYLEDINDEAKRVVILKNRK